VEPDRTPGSSEQASEQLKAIIEGAEQSAAALREQAESEAQELVRKARDAVGGVSDRVGALEEGIRHAQDQVREAGEEMARKLGEAAEPMLVALRERAEALGAELDLMGSGMAAERAPDLVEKREKREEPEPEEPTTGLAPGDVDEALEDLDATQGSDPDVASDDSPRSGEERARLAALNMALKGIPREETEKHLREELGVDDPTPVLDEVYQRAERVS
jgi:hypothetical protein